MDDAEQLRGAVGAAVEQVTREIENLRTLIAELRPASLDALGLAHRAAHARRGLARRPRVRGASRIDLDTGCRRSSRQRSTALQEALTNAGKHAGLARRGPRAPRGQRDPRQRERRRRRVDPQAPTSGFGLMGMHKRVALAGGSIEFERAIPDAPGAVPGTRFLSAPSGARGHEPGLSF